MTTAYHRDRDLVLWASIVIVVLVLALLLRGKIRCNRTAGVYVRGLWGMKCVNRYRAP